MKKSLLVLGLCFLPGIALAGDFSGSARGTTTGQFLKLGVGARAAALGEAYSAAADDASALYWNPAALTAVPGGELTFMHAPYVDSSYFDYAALAKNLGGWGSVGLGGQFLSAGNITQTDAAGNEIGTFNPHDMALSLGYARTVGGISLGVSGKLIRSTILNTAQTQAMDVGLLSPPFWQDRIKLAAVATNLGGKLKFEQEGADLPRSLRIGSAFRISQSFLTSCDGVFPADNAPYAALGAEYGVPISAQLRAAFRAGVNTRSMGDLGGFHAVSLGMGLGAKNLTVDYALQPMGSLGLTHRISVSLRWSKEKRVTYSQNAITDGYEEKISSRDRIAPRREVIFRYQDNSAKKVAIAGDFNEWVPEAMERKDGGVWTLGKELAYGVYQYKLWVDGREIAGAPGSKDREISVPSELNRGYGGGGR